MYIFLGCLFVNEVVATSDFGCVASLAFHHIKVDVERAKLLIPVSPGEARPPNAIYAVNFYTKRKNKMYSKK